MLGLSMTGKFRQAKPKFAEFARPVRELRLGPQAAWLSKEMPASVLGEAR